MNKYIAIPLLASSLIPGTSLAAEFEEETGYYCRMRSGDNHCKKGDVIFVHSQDALAPCDISKPITSVNLADGGADRIICVYRGNEGIERKKP